MRRNQSIKRFSTRDLIACCLAGGLFTLGGGLSWTAQAAITPTGNVKPTYPLGNPDPWNIVGTLEIGETADGSLTIDSGSDVTVSSFIYLGDTAPYQGTLTITGNGSSLIHTGTEAFLGDDSTGITNVLDGGLLQVTQLTVGETSGSVGQLTVNNATLTATSTTRFSDFVGSDSQAVFTNNATSNFQTLYFGDTDSSTVEINNAQLTSTGTYLGFDSTGFADVDVTNGSTWDTTFLSVGQSGSAVLDIQTGSQINNSGNAFVGRLSGSNSLITIESNSSLITAGNFVVGGTDAADGGDADVIMSNSKMVIGDTDLSNTGSTGIWVSDDDGIGGLFLIRNGGLVSGSSNVGLEIGAAFGETGTATITGTGSVLDLNGAVRVGNGTLNIQDGGYVESGTVYFGGGFTDGTINIDGGSLLTPRLESGQYSGSTSTLSLTNGGTATVTGDVLIGINANDGVNFNVTNGKFAVGDAAAAAIDTYEISFGTFDGMMIDDSNSFGGTVFINDNANLVINEDLFIGYTAGNSGTLNVSDSTSTLTVMNNTAVGRSGTGNINIRNGATANFQDLFVLALVAGSEGHVLIEDVGTNVSLSNTTAVGGFGTGSLEIRSGATVSSLSAINVADNTGGQGTLTVSNATLDGSGTWALGRFGDALINVEDGATVTNNGFGFQIAANPSSTATINISGGINGDSSLISNSGSLVSIGGANGIAGGTATVNLFGGGTLEGNGLTRVFAGGTVNIFGGTLETQSLTLETGSTINFLFGALRINGNEVMDFDFAQNIFGSTTPTISNNQAFEVGGTLTLITPTTLDGGKLGFGTLVNPFLLDWQSGTIAADVDVDSSGPLGDYVVIDPSRTWERPAGAVGGVASGSEIEMRGGTINGGATSLAVNGLLEGYGRVETSIQTGTAGEIRNTSGQALNLAGFNNAGRVTNIGSEIRVVSLATNQANADIVGEDATFFFESGLDNDGSLAFSFGTSRVFGDVTNDGSITASSGSNVTFYDDVTNNGTITVSPGTTATIFGSYSGNGIGGGGTVFLEGDTRPGFSPGTMEFGGDLYLGDGHELLIELGGDDPEDRDHLLVFGDLQLDGDLLIEFIAGYLPAYGETYEFATASSISGELNLLNTSLPGGREAVLINPTTIQFIPEPSAIAGLLGLGVALLHRRRS